MENRTTGHCSTKCTEKNTTVKTAQKMALSASFSFATSSTTMSSTKTKSRYYANDTDNNKKNVEKNQRIKISKKYKPRRENLKFLINLFTIIKIKIILCISEINQSMLLLTNINNYTNNYQKQKQNYQTCIIKFQNKREQTKIFKISFQNLNKINFLKRSIIKSFKKIIENVKITTTNLHIIVRHFVGICLIRLISLKRLKQIPENQPDKENGKLSWRIVGNTRKNAEKIKVNLKAPNYYSAYLKQEERINCKIVGNSTKCQYFNDRKWLNVANSQICQNNSHEKEQNNKEGKNRDYCSHIEKRVCQIIGNSQFLKNTYKEKLIKNEESSLNNKQKIECKEKQNYNNLKLKYKIVGNAKVEKYLYDKKDKWQNIKERDNKSQYEYYHHINHKEKSVQKIVGNSENYEFINNQSITYKNDSNVCKSLTQHGNYFPNLDKSPERQVVGNSKNYKYFNDEIKTNKDDSKEFDCNTQHDYYDLNHYEAPKRQVVGNSQYKYLTEPRRSTDKDKSKALFNNTQHDYYDFKHHGKLEIQVVGNSQNSRYLNERSEAIKNDSKSLHDIAQYDSLNQNQIVGNSQYQYLIAPSRITDKKGSKTIYYNTQYDCYDFKHHEKPKCQVVGNSQNSEYIKESKISHKNYNKNINYSTQCENCRQNQNERLASQIVGNSQNYQHLHDNSGWKYNAKEREISQISKLSLTPIEKRMYQIVGNSENFPYCNDTSESKENESSVCYYNVDDKAKTKRKPYYLSHSKKHTSQIVGNTKNYKLQYKNCHKAHNIDGGLIKSQLDYWNLQQVEKASYQIVGNSHSWPHVHNCSQISGKANKVLYNNVEVSKERQLNYSHSNTPVNQASPIVGNTTNYKYSNCNYGKHFNDHQKDKKLHIGYNNLCHIEKVMHQIVGNSQNWQHLPNLRQNNVGVNKELQFYNFTLNHLPTIEFQIVGNTKNHMFSTGNYGKQLNVHEEAGKSPHNVGQIKYCMYYIENKNCQMVGNAENCQHLKQHQNEGNVTQLRARISLCPNIEENIIIVCQVEKENYQFVGNSRNSPLLNQSYVTQRGSSLNRNEDRKILKFSSQIEQETREIVGNSQYWQHFKYPQNQVNRQSRLELSLYHNKEPQTTKNVNKYSSTPQVENYKTIGNSQNCKNSSIKYRINHKLLINCNNEKQKLTINDNRYLTHQIDKENCQIIGNSQQSQLCKQKLTEKYHHQSCQESLTFNNATKETLKFDNKYQHVCQVEKETSQIVGNSQNCQYLINKPYIKEQHLGSSSQELLILPYHNVRDRTKSQLGDYHLCHNFCRRESQQQQQQQEYEQSEENCQHFLDIFNLFHYEYYYCWHIYGFPLLSTEIFRNLKDITTVRMLTCFKISTTLPPSTYQRPSLSPTTPPAPPSTAKTKHSNDVSSSSSCGGELTKPTIIIKTLKVENIIANQQHDFIQTHKFTTTKSAYATTTTTAAAITTASLSSTSLSSSALRVSSSEMTLAAATMPYCHYQQQQEHQQQQHHHHPNYQHLHSSSSSSSSSLYHHNHHYRHIKLPSLLLLSRTLIILILLSSLWHTSEGFHGTGVKLSPNTVKTKYGLVRGIVVRSSPSLVEAYLGIPYASPPVGSLRFMPPITPSTWKSVRNADRFSPVCPQTVPIPPNGPEALLEVPRARLAQLRRLLPLLSNQSEDCLYLNIYVPYENRRHRRFTTNSGEANDLTKLPTILFIHGESYEWNSGNPYDGSELAAHGNVIVVTINFRLGIFGFLKTGGKESAQGNFGLMDLVAGLHWLKENLPAFGGDPQSITLLGHGTGAALANILMVSPVSSDLIQHTVLVSGSALSPWAIQKNPLFVKRRVAEQTGCHGDMLYDDLAPCLRTKTAAELLAVKIDHPRFLVGFAPFIDGTVISPNTDYAGKLSLPLGSAIVSTSGIEYANFPKRNLIFCLTSVESHLDLSAQDLEFGFNETRRDRILRTYVRNNFHYHLNEIFAVLKNEYTDWDKAIRSPLSSRDATLQFLSDGHTASSLIKLGYMHSLRGGQGYFLHFKHRTIEEEYPQRTGSVRGEDVPFWLGLPISPLFPHNYTTQEKQISRLMLRYLANFAKTGNPNQSSLTSPIPSSSSLIGSPSSSALSSSSSSSTSSHVTDDHQQVKRSSSNIVNATSSISGPINSNTMVVDVETAAAREALNLAVLYNQRRTKRTYYKRHSRSNDDHNGSSSASSEIGYFSNVNNKLDSDELPFWDAYDVVNQLYMELGNKAEIQSHYRGHKLSMWLNLIPQLHRHANMNDQSMRHHQFQDDLNNLNLYEGIVRAQIQIKPADDEETLLLPKGRPTAPPAVVQETNTTQKPSGGTTECGVDGAMFVAEMTTTSPTSDNRSLVLDSREKEMATASTGIIGNLEVLRRLSGKQFQSYTTALVATVAVGCFLLVLNILIFAGIYHQREKRARDAKTKEELQDNDTSKNSSMLKLNAMGSETGSFNGSGGAGVSGKTTVLFGEYSCYDEKSLQTKDEKLIVELPPSQIIEPNWMTACSTSTLDLLKTKHHHTSLEATFPLSNMVPIVTTATASTTSTGQQTEHLMAINAMEMATYNPLSMGSGLILDPTIATTSSGLLSKRGSFVGSSSQLNQYDFASVQSSDQMSFKDIENAVKVSVTRDDDITQDDDIPEPPPPPRSFQSMQHQQAQQNFQQTQQGTSGNVNASTSTASGGAGGGGILRQAGTSSATQTGGGKKRVHIQEISV